MTAHEEVLSSMKEMAAKYSVGGRPLEMPPKSNQTLGTVYCEIDFGKTLTAEIEYDERFSNPTRVFQGGFLCAGFDEVFGPLSYMAAQRPVVTLDMGTAFVRPFRPSDGSALFQPQVVAITKSLVLMRAAAKAKSGKLLATSTNTSLILSDEQLQAFAPRRK